MQDQLDLNFPRSSALAFGVSPRKVGMRARRELQSCLAGIQNASASFEARRHAERVALLGELQEKYRSAQRYGRRITRTPEGLRVRRVINELALRVVAESPFLCG